MQDSEFRSEKVTKVTILQMWTRMKRCGHSFQPGYFNCYAILGFLKALLDDNKEERHQDI